MGLVETVAANISFKSVAAFAVAALFINYVAGRIDEHVRIKRLGNYGRQFRAYLPFGTYSSPLDSLQE